MPISVILLRYNRLSLSLDHHELATFQILRFFPNIFNFIKTFLYDLNIMFNDSMLQNSIN